MNNWLPSFHNPLLLTEHLNKPFYRYDNNNKDITKIVFDTESDLIWAGDTYGRISSYTSNLTPYTRYTGHIGVQAVQDIFPFKDVGILSISDDSLHLSNRRGVTIFNLTSVNISEFSGLRSMCLGKNNFQSNEKLYIGGVNSNSPTTGIIQLDLNRPLSSISMLGTHSNNNTSSLSINSTSILNGNNSSLHSEIIPYYGKVQKIISDDKFIVVARQNGAIDLLDPLSNTIIKTFSPSHASIINSMDSMHYTLVTAGKSRKANGMISDPFVNIYDLRNMKQMPPVSFSKGTTMGLGGADFVQFHPLFPTVVVVASETGSFDFIDISNSNQRGQYIHSCNTIKTFKISPNGEHIAFLNDDNTLNLWDRTINPLSSSKNSTSLNISSIPTLSSLKNGLEVNMPHNTMIDKSLRIASNPIPNNYSFTKINEVLEYPDYVDDGPPVPNLLVDSNNHTPLSSIGMPYYNERLSSAWPHSIFRSSGTIPLNYDYLCPQKTINPVTSSISTSEPSTTVTGTSSSNLGNGSTVITSSPSSTSNFHFNSNSLGYPSNSGSSSNSNRKTSSNIKTFTLLPYNKAKYGPRNEIPEYVSLKEKRKKNSLGTISDDTFNYVPLKTNNLTVREIPEAFNKLNFIETKYGSDDSNSYDLYNKTKRFAGLEIDCNFNYANSIIQLYRFVPELFHFLVRSLKDENFHSDSLLTELGYLYDMMQRSKGSICRSSNFQLKLKSIKNKKNEKLHPQWSHINTSSKNNLGLHGRDSHVVSDDALLTSNIPNLTLPDEYEKTNSSSTISNTTISNNSPSIHNKLKNKCHGGGSSTILTSATSGNTNNDTYSQMQRSHIEEYLNRTTTSELQKFNTGFLHHLITDEIQLNSNTMTIEETFGFHEETNIYSSCSHYKKQSVIIPALTVLTPMRFGNKHYNSSKKLNNQTILSYIENSMKWTKKITSICDVCNKKESITIEKTIKNLPPVFSLEVHLSINEWNIIRKVRDWLSKEFYAMNFNDKCIIRTSPNDYLKYNIPTFKYELCGFICRIHTLYGEENLVTFVKSYDNGEGVKGYKWYMINDYLVLEVEEEEALNMSYWWKTVEIVLYCDTEELKKPLFTYMNEFDVKSDGSIEIIKEQLQRQRNYIKTLNTNILYRDYFINGITKDIQKQYKLLTRQEAPQIGSLVAIDAEFVTLQREINECSLYEKKYIIRPEEKALARLSILRGDDGENFGQAFVDDYIMVEEPIIDYLTRYSGIVPGDLYIQSSRKPLVMREVAYRKVWLLLQMGCIFVGHGLDNDFRQINIQVSKNQIHDTAEYFLHGTRKLSLRYLAWGLLKKNVQEGNHDSIEDAYTALLLYKKYLELKRTNELDTATNMLYENGHACGFKVPSETET
ncbi:hypothetical protein TBLA_0B05250 [Henningerozyma blattae CBS 6284]|uniref:Exonuclease domain-containing protein n=1 Tax=Henningerozyma blattae (strain ATCC 34711 / CBS 6284 / DSM 70876 / NBRC 10599 / NRRL Y-10934 / UCD 77-7) TaxID=1071380 RepID=I2GZ05_HENB6|nr:hypothetical protein TBLA_0B05250 [Tetrapisispora blattae CBS 6284]CCH59357.1 hypothetical protein TBLA_0B05250 [Tetrapisispora blattae CBS 6284]